MEILEEGMCSLCGYPYDHYGNNPEPLMRFEHRCCDACNMEKVIPARLAVMRGFPIPNQEET